ncbi:hypothetical protein OHS70_34135 [Streptomyces sp. NBC_00390]
MSPTVEITTKAEDDAIEVVEDLDAISSTDVMLGCGNDNPF